MFQPNKAEGYNSPVVTPLVRKKFKCPSSISAENYNAASDKTLDYPNQQEFFAKYPPDTETDGESSECAEAAINPLTKGKDCGETNSDDSPILSESNDGQSSKAARRKVAREYRRGKRKSGAILLPEATIGSKRTTIGKQKTCLPDAVHNAILLLTNGKSKISIAKLRKAVPTLGNDLRADWKSMNMHLKRASDHTYVLVCVTPEFNRHNGCLFNLLHANKDRVFVVSSDVSVANGMPSRHCHAQTTKSFPGAELGLLIDNHSKSKPVAIESLDRKSKNSAKHKQGPYYKLFQQRSPNCPVTNIDVKEVYELIWIPGTMEYWYMNMQSIAFGI